jgi:hypothetical protein
MKIFLRFKNMNYPWVPDERGEKLVIPKELYEEIRKIVRIREKDKNKNIIYQTTTQRDINQFFHITK